MSFVTDASTVIAGVTAAAGLIGGSLTLYRRSIGRRRESYRRISRLGTGAHLAFFVAVLREPPAVKRIITKDDYFEYVTDDDPRFASLPGAADDLAREARAPREFVEAIFVDRDFYVQTITDTAETVLAFSVTTRHRRFRPVFEAPPHVSRRQWRRYRKAFGAHVGPLMRVRLGGTRFADTDPAGRTELFADVVASIGAQTQVYSEYHYLGNGGAYQTYVLTTSNTTPFELIGNLWDVNSEIGDWRWPPADDSADLDVRSRPALQAFRRENVITTYTVVGLSLDRRNFPASLGILGRDLRTLP